MNPKETDEKIESVEKPDDWWYRIYVAVAISAVVVIAALAAFTRYFS